MTSTRKLPSWVSTEERGLFKEEVMKKLGPQHVQSTTWLSSWKPKDVHAKMYFSYITKNDDEFVSRSKSFKTAELGPSPKKCVICNKRFLLPTWVCFTYKYKDGITKEEINDSKHLACITTMNVRVFLMIENKRMKKNIKKQMILMNLNLKKILKNFIL